MARKNWEATIEDLFRRNRWDEARRLLEAERAKDPTNHWLITQIGVTFYEQREYEAALQRFRESLTIVEDCPLTLWNLAGTLDALGYYTDSIRVYTWLLRSEKSAEDDPCWESGEWADSLKADCVYRLGVCFDHLGRKRKAEDCYRRYLDLLLTGIPSTYSAEDVTSKIRGLKAGRNGSMRSELRRAVKSALETSGVAPRKGRNSEPPKFRDLPVGRRAASKQ